MPKEDTQFKPGNDAGVNTRWQPGQSGGGGGKTRRQREFEEALADALVGQDPKLRAEYLATLVWAAAKKSEPWAIQLLFQRLAPMPVKVQLSREDEHDRIDYSKLTDAELDTLEQLILKAGPVAAITSGEGAKGSA